MADEYFGEVRWNEDDLRNALEENDVKSTDERVAQLRKLCEHTDFEDAMICAEWDIIYGCINTTRFSTDEIDRAAARLCMDRERAIVLLRNWDNGHGDVDDVIDRYEDGSDG